MQPARHAVAPEQEDAEEGRLEEERGQDLVAQKRPDDVAGRVGKAAPVGAELEGHDDPGHDAHAERDGKDLGPESGQLAMALAAAEPGRLQHHDPGSEADRERRKQDVERDDEGELQAGEE